MSDLRINYGVYEQEVGPIFYINLASSDKNDENMLLFNMSRVLDLAIMLYDAKILVGDVFFKALVNEQFPLGACSMIYFKSFEEGVRFGNTIIKTFQ